MEQEDKVLRGIRLIRYIYPKNLEKLNECKEETLNETYRILPFLDRDTKKLYSFQLLSIKCQIEEMLSKYIQSDEEINHIEKTFLNKINADPNLEVNLSEIKDIDERQRIRDNIENYREQVLYWREEILKGNL